MLLQPTASDSARTRTTHSAQFVRLWRLRVERRPLHEPDRQNPGEDLDPELALASHERAQRVDGWIPRVAELASTSRHAHKSVGWGPSPSAHAIHRGRMRNVRAENRLTHTSGCAVKGDAPASWNSLDELRARFADPRRPITASYEPPSAEHPTGRSWLGPISQMAGASAVWTKLKTRQRRIALHFFAGNVTAREIGEQEGVSHTTILGVIDTVRRRFAAAGLPEPKPDHAGRPARSIESYSAIPLNNQ